jgi:hypothetical protein
MDYSTSRPNEYQVNAPKVEPLNLLVLGTDFKNPMVKGPNFEIKQPLPHFPHGERRPCDAVTLAAGGHGCLGAWVTPEPKKSGSD